MNALTIYHAPRGHIYTVVNKYHDGGICTIIVTGIGTYLFDGASYATLRQALDAVAETHRRATER